MWPAEAGGEEEAASAGERFAHHPFNDVISSVSFFEFTDLLGDGVRFSKKIPKSNSFGPEGLKNIHFSRTIHKSYTSEL